MLDVSMLGLCSVRRKEEFVFGFETIFYIELNVVKFCWYDVFISSFFCLVHSFILLFSSHSFIHSRERRGPSLLCDFGSYFKRGL